MGTDKGYTGQYSDPLTGLDYDHARYYNAVSGIFLSPDSVQGMNPYSYVGGNPETTTDPTGHYFAPPGGGGNGNPPPSCSQLGTCGSGNSSGYGEGNGNNHSDPSPQQPTHKVNLNGGCNAACDDGL
jgi:RHS repeat-associated protein